MFLDCALKSLLGDINKTPNNDLLGKSSISTLKQLGSKAFDGTQEDSTSISLNENIYNYKFLIIELSYYNNGVATMGYTIYPTRLPLGEYISFFSIGLDLATPKRVSINAVADYSITVSWSGGTWGRYICVFGI